MMAVDLTRGAAAKPKASRLSMLVFSDDLQDARFHKRLCTFSDTGFSVRWLAYDRGRNTSFVSDLLQTLPGEVLGRTHDAQYIQRAWSMAFSSAKLLRSRFLPGNTRILYCINLDNLLVAILVKFMRGLRCRIVYEVADIQPVLLRQDAVGKALRAIQRWCLKRADLVVYTSENYMSEFLAKHQGYRGPSLLLENKIYPAPAPNRALNQRSLDAGGRVAVGLFGQLKCRTSFEMIRGLASSLPDKICFVLRGYPNRQARELFHQVLSDTPNITFLGPYRYPSELPEAYSSVDLCWGFDFCSPGRNSKWCLANRLYEAGYFGVPILVEDDTAGGDYVRRHGSGWVFPHPLDESLRSFFSRISRGELEAKKEQIARLDKSLFVLDSDLPRIRGAFGGLCR